MSIMDRLPKWVRTNRFYYSETVAKDKLDSSHPEAFEKSCRERKEVSVFDANLVSSKAWAPSNMTEIHYPMLDLDMECELIPSSTPGHYHLYINKPMVWDKYFELLTALNKAGIIQTGVLRAAELQRETCLRPPWVSKPN